MTSPAHFSLSLASSPAVVGNPMLVRAELGITSPTGSDTGFKPSRRERVAIVFDDVVEFPEEGRSLLVI